MLRSLDAGTMLGVVGDRFRVIRSRVLYWCPADNTGAIRLDGKSLAGSLEARRKTNSAVQLVTQSADTA